MKYRLVHTPAFRRDVRAAEKRNYNLAALSEVLELLRSGERLPEKYRDHPLKGNLKGFRELHIEPDWLLVYIRNKRELILTLSRTGSHAELLKK